jgi:hypothetical protein
MIVAVARKLAIALWRFLEQGLVPQGGHARHIYSSDAPSGALGGSEVWLLWGFADLAQPVCRTKDEPRPSCAIVHACSRVASRNGAAGYKLMRSSHATWTSTLTPPTTSIPR